MSAIAQSPEKEYEKNLDIKKDEITKLQEWLIRQPHLPKLTELDLILFYYSCQNSMELTKSVIDIHFTMRTHLDVFFSDMDPKSSKNVHTLETVLLTPLPKATKEGYKILYGRLVDYEPANFFLENACKLVVMISDLWQYEQGTFPGIVIMLDMEGISFGHLGRLNVMSIKRIMYYLQEAFPMRLKGFHFINTPSFMDKILMLIKPFMKKEFYNFLHLHPAPIDSVYEYLPKENFPKEAGGEWDSFGKIQGDMKSWLTKNSQFFIDREKLKVDETKRAGKLKDANDVFGIEGSFKKLDID